MREEETEAISDNEALKRTQTSVSLRSTRSQLPSDRRSSLWVDRESSSLLLSDSRRHVWKQTESGKVGRQTGTKGRGKSKVNIYKHCRHKTAPGASLSGIIVITEKATHNVVLVVDVWLRGRGAVLFTLQPHLQLSHLLPQHLHLLLVACLDLTQSLLNGVHGHRQPVVIEVSWGLWWGRGAGSRRRGERYR